MRESNRWRKSDSRSIAQIIGNWRFAAHSVRFGLPRFDRDMPMKLLFSIILLLASYCAMGCSNEMETGYKPHALNSSTTLRRGYYATPFSPEAEAANREKKAGQQANRPGFDTGY